MKKIIIDTNFLMIPVQFNVDVFSEIERLFGENYKLFIIDKTIDELKKLMTIKGNKNKIAAKIGLSFIEKFNITQIISDKKDYVDNAIINECLKDKELIVATNDIALKNRLKKKEIHYLELRQKNYLTLH